VDKLLPKTNNRSSEKVGVLHLYFDYKHSKSQKAEDVLRCLLKQLVYQMDSLPPQLESAYDKCVNKGGPKPNTKNFADVLEECLKHFYTVFILLDAFDECLEAERSALVDYLRRFSECGLKLFLTTRTHLEGKLKDRLKGVEPQVMKIAARVEDVAKFLTEELKKNEKELDDELSEEIVKRISIGVDGQYELAIFHTNGI
jgi:hypothetical protein